MQAKESSQSDYRTSSFPKSRIATLDVLETGKRKHHVAGLIELDVTQIRKSIKEYKRGKSQKISFLSWFISTIGQSLKRHEAIAAFLASKSKILIFNDINVSIVIEKEAGGQKVPIPLIIEKAQERSIESINEQILSARAVVLSEKDIVLQKKAQRYERIYYSLPGCLRRLFWRYLLSHPKMAYRKMGNVALTSVGMFGKVSGWFIPTSVHPVCFGLSSIVKKPVVRNDTVEIREILHLSLLFDHDVVDGAQMARFLSDFCKEVEEGRVGN